MTGAVGSEGSELTVLEGVASNDVLLEKDDPLEPAISDGVSAVVALAGLMPVDEAPCDAITGTMLDSAALEGVTFDGAAWVGKPLDVGIADFICAGRPPCTRSERETVSCDASPLEEADRDLSNVEVAP